MGTEGYVVASSLRAVLAQRLVRRICESCSCPELLDAGIHSWLSNYNGRVELPTESTKFKRGRGCPACNNTGYSGRIGIFELLEINIELADALRRNDSADFASVARNLPGFVSLSDSALQLALDGITSMEEVLRVSGQLDESLVELSPEIETASVVEKNN
jgi:MSHA biogenesis protein MshE